MTEGKQRKPAVSLPQISQATATLSTLVVLFNRSHVAGQAGLAHVSRLGVVEAAPAMHGGAVVPDHQVVQLPGMRINEMRLGDKFDKIAQNMRNSGTRQPSMSPACADSKYRSVTASRLA